MKSRLPLFVVSVYFPLPLLFASAALFSNVLAIEDGLKNRSNSDSAHDGSPLLIVIFSAELTKSVKFSSKSHSHFYKMSRKGEVNF